MQLAQIIPNVLLLGLLAPFSAAVPVTGEIAGPRPAFPFSLLEVRATCCPGQKKCPSGACVCGSCICPAVAGHALQSRATCCPGQKKCPSGACVCGSCICPS